MMLPPAPAMGAAIPKTFFGMHVQNMVPPAYNLYGAKQCPMFADLGYGAVRLYESYVTQMFCNPASGTYSWAALDTLVGYCAAVGVEIVYMLGNLPAWATGGSATHYNPLPPTNMTYLSDFVTALVARYKGRIKFYELWNEIDSSGAWTGTLAQMQTIWTTLAPIIRAGDPAATILTGNIAGFGSMNILSGIGYLDQVLQGSGVAGAADVLAVHTYCDPTQPEFVVRFGQYAAALAKRYSYAQVHATESGALKWYDAAGVLQAPLSGGAKMPAAQASGWVTRLGLCHWLGGFARWYYYCLDGNGFMAWDMIDYTGSGATASVEYAPALAFKYLAQTLTGARVFGFSWAGMLFSCQFVQANGRRGTIWWTADYQSASVNAAAAVQVTDNLGGALAPSATLAVGSQPVFVWWS